MVFISLFRVMEEMRFATAATIVAQMKTKSTSRPGILSRGLCIVRKW